MRYVEEIIIVALCHEDDDGSGLNESHYKGVMCAL